MDGSIGHRASSQYENISGTIASGNDFQKGEFGRRNPGLPSRPGCAYVVTMGRHGRAPRFCTEPAVAGSPYCARHRALCRLAPGTRPAMAADRAADAPPPELAHLAACAVLDPADPDEDAAEGAEMLDALGVRTGAAEDEP